MTNQQKLQTLRNLTGPSLYSVIIKELGPGTKNIIRDEDEQQKRVNTLIFVLKYITRLAGFELLNRIEIKDRKTGREYR